MARTVSSRRKAMSRGAPKQKARPAILVRCAKCGTPAKIKTPPKPGQKRSRVMYELCKHDMALAKQIKMKVSKAKSIVAIFRVLKGYMAKAHHKAFTKDFYQAMNDFCANLARARRG